MKNKPILFDISFQEAQFSEEQGMPMIRNVSLLGSDSIGANKKIKRRYTRECMESAVPLYNGIRAFVNHPSSEEMRTGMRDVHNMAGRFINPRFDANEMRIRGDFEGLPNDPAAQKFVAIARNMPEIAGCSQHGFAKARMENGVEVVESLQEIRSVDLVVTPATTGGLFESQNPDNEGAKVMEYPDISLPELKAKRPDLVTLLVQEGQESRDTEVQEAIKIIDGLRKENDEFKVKEVVRHKAEVIEAVLVKSELPPEAITDVFRSSLSAVGGSTDAEISTNASALIDDRKAVLESVTGGVKNVTEKGGEKDKGKGKEMSVTEVVKTLTTQ